MTIMILQDLFVALENERSRIPDAITESIGKLCTSTTGVMEGGEVQNFGVTGESTEGDRVSPMKRQSGSCFTG